MYLFTQLLHNWQDVTLNSEPSFYVGCLTKVKEPILPFYIDGPVSWSCRIHQLHLCRGVRLIQRMS